MALGYSFAPPVPGPTALSTGGVAQQAAIYIQNHTRLPANDAVRTAVAAALVESSGSEPPITSWARELSTTRLRSFATQPAAEHLLIDKLSTAFRAKHNAFAMDTAGGQPCESEAEKVASMQSSVMCKIGGAASPFERTRQQVMQAVALELTTAIEQDEAKQQAAVAAKGTSDVTNTVIALMKQALYHDVIVPLRPVENGFANPAKQQQQQTMSMQRFVSARFVDI